jgi:hypothetical protein
MSLGSQIVLHKDIGIKLEHIHMIKHRGISFFSYLINLNNKQFTIKLQPNYKEITGVIKQIITYEFKCKIDTTGGYIVT